jgi:uncharacterized membrane protein YraQ (UPF0718 family)
VGSAAASEWPYYLRAFAAAANHSIGASTVTGTAAAPPEASLHAAWDYARAYFLAIWQAMMLGLLLAATIESSLPRDLLVRLLGTPGMRSSAVAGLLSLPGMMCTCCTAPVALACGAVALRSARRPPSRSGIRRSTQRCWSSCCSRSGGNSLPIVVALAIAGTLFVIPTAGEIPINQTMLGFGMGPVPPVCCCSR